MRVMALVKEKATKAPPDPRITEIKEEFVTYCKNLRNFEPGIDHGKDGAVIKRRLGEHSKDTILDCFSWFLTCKDFENFSPTISTALSNGVFNKFLSKR
jgi:hypothetical protein